MAENKTYSHEDIKRYLQQQMLQQEMYAFEKAMMDDPFLSDAVDGYTTANWQQTAHHLTTIEKEISEPKTQTKIVPFVSKKNNWWRIAAMIIFIVTGGMITYSVLNKSVNEPESANSLAVNNAPVAPINYDTLKSGEPSLQKLEMKVENEIAGNKQITPPMLSKEKNASVARLDKAEVSANDISTASAGATESLKNQEQMQADVVDAKKPSAGVAMSPKKANEFKGQVLTKEGEPVPFASVKIADQNVATSTDANGKFTLQSNDSVVKVDVNSVGYATANTNLKTNAPINKITLQENNHSLSEVVVTGYSTKKRKALSQSMTKVSATEINAVPEPVNGWNIYHQYLKEQVDSTLLADNKTRTNISVEVDFSINKKGQPVKLKPQNKLDKYYTKKAMYFITHGTLWKNSETNNKAKVTVTF